MTDRAMEDRLKALVAGNSPENREHWAVEWKVRGGKVLGILDAYVPQEVVYAGGVLPFRITGAWQDAVPLAGAYRPAMTCQYCTHVLESIMSGELGFLDGVAVTNLDDDFKRLWDVLVHLKKFPVTHIMYLPRTVSGHTVAMWAESVEKLKGVVEQLAGREVRDEDLHQAMETYGRRRVLLRKLYELRKRKLPPLTGAEVLGITTAAGVMPADEFNQQLESLLPYLETRQAVLKQFRPRLLVSSDHLDNPAYVELVEDAGSLVAMDDLDTGSRYFWAGGANMGSTDRNLRIPSEFPLPRWERSEPVLSLPKDEGESVSGPLQALAEYHLKRPSCPRMRDWDRQVKQVLDWVKEFEIDGVVELRQLYSLPLEFRHPYFERGLKQAGIPLLSLTREYHLSHAAMLRTRIEAFIEMLTI